MHGTAIKYSLKNKQKTVDRRKRLCYIIHYLSDERFIFARFFAGKKLSSPYTGRQCPVKNSGK